MLSGYLFKIFVDFYIFRNKKEGFILLMEIVLFIVVMYMYILMCSQVSRVTSVIKGGWNKG